MLHDLPTLAGALPVLAAGAAPPFFAEVASLLLASAAMAYLCHRLKITPIVSFLVTGALIGPHALGLVRDPALIEAAAEVGVVLLLFTIGIEFSLEKLARIQRLIFLGGGLQVGLVIAAVTGLLALAGVGWQSGVYTGCLVALSSTAIVLKLLMGRGETDTPGGRSVLGILIFQDLAVVAMVLLVPMLGTGGGSAPASAGGIAWALAKAGLIVALVLVVARRVMPKVLEAVARTCSQEIFVLTVMAICFGTAWLTSLAGVSLSLGAFLAGLVVSESRFSDMAFGEIQPLQILFSATFFVSVGLLLDLEFMMANLGLVLALVGAVLLVKLIAAGVAVRALGFGAGTVAFSSLMIAQVGEFSFVLERTGREAGLFPAGVEAGGPQVFIAATVLLMMATPILAAVGRKAEARSAARARRAQEADAAIAPEATEVGGSGGGGAPPGDGHGGHGDLDRHVIIAGYGEGGRALARALSEAGIDHLILTLSPQGALDAEADGLRVIRGNYGRQHELSLAGLRRARLLVVPDDDPETTRRVVRSAKALHPELPVLASARFDGEIEELRHAGADEVVSYQREGVRRLVEAVLDGDVAVRPEEPGTVRLSRAQRENAACTHAAETRPVVPRSDGCEECLALGEEWVHLRLCMTCGHVGCCDESKNHHATAHFHAAGHPIVRSHQPGETWAWCYADEIVL